MRGIHHHEDWSWSNIPRFGGSSGSTTTTQTSTPWAGETPYLSQVYGNAAYDFQNSTPQYYPSSTYVPMNGTQQSLMSNLIGSTDTGGDTGLQAANSNIASTLSPSFTAQTQGTFNQATPELGYLAGGSVLNDTSAPFNDVGGTLTGYINGSGTSQTQPAYSQGQNYLSNVIGGSGVSQTQPAFGQSNSYLSGMIGGDTLNPFSAPGFQNVVSGTLANVLPSISSSFVNGGRDDSGLATAAETSAATNAVGALANQNYVQEQGLQQGASQQAQAAQEAQLQQQQQAEAQAAANQTEQQQLQQAAAAQAASNEGLGLNTTLSAEGQAANNLLTQQGNQSRDTLTAPMVDQQATNDLSTALSASGMMQTDAQNQLNANIAAYNYGQMLPWNQLGMFESAVTGAGNPGGTTTTQQPYFTNPLANISSAASGLGSLGMLAFSAFSDRNLKTDIEEIGEAHNGLPLYSFRYLWEGPMSRHIGLIAQDVEKVKPEAVIHTPIGRAVNYTEALAA